MGASKQLLNIVNNGCVKLKINSKVICRLFSEYAMFSDIKNDCMMREAVLIFTGAMLIVWKHR